MSEGPEESQAVNPPSHVTLDEQVGDRFTPAPLPPDLMEDNGQPSGVRLSAGADLLGPTPVAPTPADIGTDTFTDERTYQVESAASLVTREGGLQPSQSSLGVTYEAAREHAHGRTRTNHDLHRGTNDVGSKDEMLRLANAAFGIVGSTGLGGILGVIIEFAAGVFTRKPYDQTAATIIGTGCTVLLLVILFVWYQPTKRLGIWKHRGKLPWKGVFPDTKSGRPY